MSAASKQFGSSTREVPHTSQKAQKWYPTDDEPQKKQVCISKRRLASVSVAWDGELYDIT
jgi:hypothetical protein